MGFVEEMLEADAPCAGDGSMEEQNTFFVRRGSGIAGRVIMARPKVWSEAAGVAPGLLKQVP
jgi:hypothetical protein